MKKEQGKFLVLILSGLLLFSCRGPNEPIPLRSPELEGPVVTGLIMTNERSPDPVGVWGKPSAPEGPIGTLNIHNPYPNPFNPACTIPFELNRSMFVKMWVVPAAYPGMDYDDRILMANGVVRPASGLSVKIMINQQINSGIHNIHWDGRDDQGNLLPNGFYRIYIQGNGILLWRDVLLLEMEYYISPELIKIVNSIFREHWFYER